MLGKKKKATSSNPEVQAAMDARDQLMEDVQTAVEKVDRLNELLAEYTEANGREP